MTSPFRHIGLKLVALAIAVVLWIAVSGEDTVERGLRAPLELQQFPPNLEIQGEPPSFVDVRMRGTSGALSRIGQGDVVAVLDLHTAREGNRLFAITPDQVKTPFGVEVIQVTPSAVTLSFEPSATRQLPVSASVEGKPAPGFVVGAVTVTPERVDVVGPESAVRRATEALTEPVSVTDAQREVHEVVTLGLVDPALRLKTQRTANVVVQIIPAPMERIVHGLPIHLNNVGRSVSAQAVPPVVDIVLRGRREPLTRLRADEVVAFVDVGTLGPGEYTVPVQAEAPDEAGVMRINPSSVQVRITSAKN
jgi:YbbR domain-containing protein